MIGGVLGRKYGKRFDSGFDNVPKLEGNGKTCSLVIAWIGIGKDSV
jgi:hypothetical protein